MDEPRRGGVGRALEAFANAVLERTLPRIRQWLVTRLGPMAELAALELDGARVHLVDARIPLGPRAILHASRTTFVTSAEDLAIGLPPIRLERLEGRVELLGANALSASVTLEGAPERGSDAWIAGIVTLRDLAIAGRAYEGTARVRLTSERFGIEGARLADLEASSWLEVHAGGTFESGEFRLTEARADADATPIAAFLEAIAALRGAGVTALPISGDARVSGHCELARDGALSAALEASVGGQPRAELVLDGHTEDGALRGHARGHLAPSLLALSAISVEGTASLEGAPLAFEATLDATIGQPRIEITARSTELELRSSRASEPLRISRVRATMTVDGGVVLEARARVGRGSLAVSLADGAVRLKIERAELAPALSFLPARAAALVRRLALDEGEAWLDVRAGADAIEGVAHLESPRASVTIDPLRVIRETRSMERSVLRARLDARSIDASIAGAADLTLAIERASASELRAEGNISSRELLIALGDREPATVRDARARVAIRDGELQFPEATASVFGGAIHGAATWDGAAARVVVSELALESLREPLARWALSADRARGRQRKTEDLRELLPGLLVSGRLARSGGALRGEVRAHTPRSALSMRVVVSDEGSLAGTELEASIVLADVAPLFARWTIAPASSAVWRIEGRLDGTLAAPRLDLDARCPEQLVLFHTQRAPIEMLAEDVRARARATRDRVVWSELVARAYGGTLRSRGSAAFAGAASARLELDDARAEALPLGRGGTLGAHLSGALGGTLDLWRAGDAWAIGCGRLRVTEPEYPILTRAADLARRSSLPLPDLRGVEPLLASVRLGARGWRFSEISARVSQLRVTGEVEVGRDGSLDGRLVAHPQASWLSTSPLLGPLASLLDEVPARLCGSLSSPRLYADAWDTADGLLARSAFGRQVRAMLGELAPDGVTRPSRADGRRGRGTANLLTTDALLDRLARDPADAAELFEALIERGLRADEIAAGVAKRR